MGTNQERRSHILIVLPETNKKSVEFHWWNDWPAIEELVQNLKCPFDSVKKRRKRRFKTL